MQSFNDPFCGETICQIQRGTVSRTWERPAIEVWRMGKCRSAVIDRAGSERPRGGVDEKVVAAELFGVPPARPSG
jgi:hypothetical protein